MTQRFDIGFLGGGQLARMSIQAAQRMGLSCLSLEGSKLTPASQIAAALDGELNDVGSLAALIGRCDHFTLENEFVLADNIEDACDIARVSAESMVPSIGSLDTIQDKLRQRVALLEAGVASPKAVALDDDGSTALDEIGFPMVLKARFGGYDGKGTRYARTYGDLEQLRPVWQTGDWLAEQFVPFKRELAVMAFVGRDSAGCFPTMETIQTNHVCDLVFPSGIDASEIALSAVGAVAGVGLYGVELFELEDGSLLVNEMAPRPHNSGHYTLDWGGVSQFEQHVRLVMGWPPIEPRGLPVCMANLLGKESTGNHVRAIEAALSVPDVYFHWYGKAASRPGRKMGHLNAVGEDCVERAVRARELFYAAW